MYSITFDILIKSLEGLSTSNPKIYIKDELVVMQGIMGHTVMTLNKDISQLIKHGVMWYGCDNIKHLVTKSSSLSQ